MNGYKGVEKMYKDCPECGEEIYIPEDIEEGELCDCPICGASLEFHKGKLVISDIVGEDFGE